MLAVAQLLLEAQQVFVATVQHEVVRVQDCLCLHQKGVVLESRLTGGDVNDSSYMHFRPL